MQAAARPSEKMCCRFIMLSSASRPCMQVEVIVHCAANTGFHVPLDEIMTTNVGGFMEVLNIAASCKRLQVPLPDTAIAYVRPCMHPTPQSWSSGRMQQGDACCVARLGDAAVHSWC